MVMEDRGGICAGAIATSDKDLDCPVVGEMNFMIIKSHADAPFTVPRAHPQQSPKNRPVIVSTSLKRLSSRSYTRPLIWSPFATEACATPSAVESLRKTAVIGGSVCASAAFGPFANIPRLELPSAIEIGPRLGHSAMLAKPKPPRVEGSL